MRIIRIVLVLVFLAVGGLYLFNDLVSDRSAAAEPPVISCDSEILEVSVNDGDGILLEGVTAADPQDGDLTGQILVSGVSKLIDGDTAKVTYVVFDADDNMATLTRHIRYTDYRLPRFSLDEPLIYTANEEIILLDRLHAEDAIDGDITDLIRVSYTLPTADPEVYTVDVQVTNSMGDTAFLTLPIIIRNEIITRPVVELDTCLVYLEQGSTFRARRYLSGATYDGLSVSSDNVSISGDVDTDVPGTYQVRYTCTYAGRTGDTILTVVVE